MRTRPGIRGKLFFISLAIIVVMALISGVYEIRFEVGPYLQAQANDASFLDVIPVRFTIDAAESHYHVPLLLSPYGYTTYRGS